MKLPDQIRDEKELEELLSRPSADLTTFMSSLKGDLIILGAAGKMGVTLGMLAARSMREASAAQQTYAASRFSDPAARTKLQSAGVETIACDLLDRSQVAKLPRVPNVIYMAGRKFGTTENQEMTWAVNVLAPDIAADHYRESRIVAFSTGCVYPLKRPEEGLPDEAVPPAPLGEYAQSCLGRERVFDYYSKSRGTKICQFRLNYAIDLRYGVLHDIGRKVFTGEPVDLSVSHFNCIWQGDANRMALLSLQHCASPPVILNITGPETISVAETARQFGELFGKKPRFVQKDADAGMYLSDAGRSHELFGRPAIDLGTMIHWQARWIAGGGHSLDKPTKFETTSGKF